MLLGGSKFHEGTAQHERTAMPLGVLTREHALPECTEAFPLLSSTAFFCYTLGKQTPKGVTVESRYNEIHGTREKFRCGGTSLMQNYCYMYAKRPSRERNNRP